MIDRDQLVQQIKDALRACNTVAEVNDVARRHKDDVADLDERGGPYRTMAIQIRNLAMYKRGRLDPDVMHVAGRKDGAQ